MVMESIVNNALSTDNSSGVTALSPHSVGREFVRQYYTMLNQGPQLLHRFYHNDSSFVHGGVDRPGEVSNPVFGRDAIGKKIDSLNFCDCHAKILQVDCMETIANGIVIQITGELSNNGQQMRRFLQTFVLAPLGHNKYYVRNDIFRYQDEIFSDEDEYTESGKAEDERVDVINQQPQPQQLVQVTEKVENENINLNDGKKDSLENLNGSNEIESSVVHEDKPQEKKLEVGQFEAPGDVFVHSDADAQNGRYPNSSPIPQNTNEHQQKTYANMVSKNANGPFLPPFQASNNPSNTFIKPELNNQLLASFNVVPTETPSPTPTQPANSANLQTSPNPTAAGKSPSSGGSQSGREFYPPRDFQPKEYPNRDYLQRDPRPNIRRGNYSMQTKRNDPVREMTPGRAQNEFESIGDGEYLNRKQYPDEQQVFVGNLPQHIVEDNLRESFSTFGKILDVRINRQNQKMGINNKIPTPNYGFVTFESAEVVQEILKKKPIYFSGHRFNVEEKRSQQNKAQSGNISGDMNRPGSFNRQSGIGTRINSFGNISSGNRPQMSGNQQNRNRGNQYVPNSGGSRSTGGMNSGGFSGARNNFSKQQPR